MNFKLDASQRMPQNFPTFGWHGQMCDTKPKELITIVTAFKMKRLLMRFVSDAARIAASGTIRKHVDPEFVHVHGDESCHLNTAWNKQKRDGHPSPMYSGVSIAFACGARWRL